MKAGGSPLPGFTTLLAALILSPQAQAPLFCCRFLGLDAIPFTSPLAPTTTTAVVPGPPTLQLSAEALPGSCVCLQQL